MLRQLLYQIILQYSRLHRPHFWQHLFQNCALLNEPACSGFALLDPIPRLRFFQPVLCLQQFLSASVIMRKPSLSSFLPDDFIAQRVGKLDSFDIAQGFPLELIGQV